MFFCILYAFEETKNMDYYRDILKLGSFEQGNLTISSYFVLKKLFENLATGREDTDIAMHDKSKVVNP